MKTIIKNTLAVFVFLAFYSAQAQDAKDAKAKHNDMSSWAELKTFHMVMAQTFHPSEEGDLKPIRERSGELYEKAMALDKSKAPAEFNTPEIKAATSELVKKTKELNDLIKSKGSDEKVKELLASAHDSFHKIVGLCKGGESHDERHEEHKE